MEMKKRRRQDFMNKVARGPLGSVLFHGPLAKYRAADDAQDPTAAVPDLKEVNYNFHKLTLDELATSFRTSTSQGLTSSSVAEVLARDGPNRLKPPETHYIRKILRYMFGGFCWMLWIGSIICFIAWEPLGEPNPDPTNLGLAIVLLLVIAITAGFEAFQDWSSGQIMKSITNMMASDATVIRNGVETKVPADQLVVGDLVVLSYGQKVPADLRLIEASDLKFDRAMLTGESEAVDGLPNCTDETYSESKNIAFMATMVTNGTGKGIITLTGSKTMIGSIAVMTGSSKPTKTTLQIEIKNFITIIAIMAIVTIVVCYIVWGTWLQPTFPGYINTSAMLVNAIAILVAFIPQGLPVSVTLSLLLVARRMAKRKVLVKNLSVIETLSCVNVIASDKTGTLTQNKMFVINASAGLTVISAEQARRASIVSSPRTLYKSTQQLLNICLLCNEAKFETQDEAKPVNERAATGGATDIAILKYGAGLCDVASVESHYTELSRIPFNSRNKWMAKVFCWNASVNKIASSHNLDRQEENTNMDCFDLSDDQCVISMKGAPDILIDKCTTILCDDGSEAPLDDATTLRLRKLQNEWCELGQRVLLLCKKHDKLATLQACVADTAQPQRLEKYLRETNDLCIVGMVGIIDKPRDGIDRVIAACRTAGVRLFMVTGDFSVTAAAIAKQIGIFSSNKYDTLADMLPKRSLPRDDEEAESQCCVGLRAKLAACWAKMPLVNSSDAAKRGNTKGAVFVRHPQFHSLMLTGKDIETLAEDDWRTVTRYEEIVFARTTPSQKLTVVEQFKQDRYIVAVTGDGVNDSPALKAANIGIAMGGGSEVAMEAAQMVLLDNNFESMLIAIENGRLVFDNLRKCINYLLPAGSFSSVVPCLLNIYLGVPTTLSPFQKICICVLTDLAPSMAMMTEKSEGDLLLRPPRVVGRDRLVDKQLLLYAYFFLGIFECFFALFLFFIYMYTYGGITPGQIFLAFQGWKDGYLGMSMQHLDYLLYTGQTVMFVTLVMVQTFGNIFITRTHKMSLFRSLPFMQPNRNLWLFLAQAISIVLMVIVIYVPFFNNVFHTSPPPIEFYFIPLAFCVVFIAVDELRKLGYRRGIKFFVDTAW